VVSVATTLFALGFPEVRRLRARHAPLPELAEAA
jgi:hypothetical protein